MINFSKTPERQKKDLFIKIRVTETLKRKFKAKLAKDGIGQSDFFNACLANYLKYKTYDGSLSISKKHENRH